MVRKTIKGLEEIIADLEKRLNEYRAKKMDNGNIKRVNLRINIENPIDKIIWNYIKDKKKKVHILKK